MERLMFTFLLVVASFNMLFGQLKYEKEYRLKSFEVPENAKAFISKLNFTSKIKWYREEGLNSSSIEAKTKYNSTKYSIEFNDEGILEDIEIEIGWDKIEKNALKVIFKYFDDNFQKHSVSKIQLQLIGKPDLLAERINKQVFEKNKEINSNYEIVAKVKEKGKYRLMEFLFNDEGKIIKKSIITLKNTDNLEY